MRLRPVFVLATAALILGLPAAGAVGASTGPSERSGHHGHTAGLRNLRQLTAAHAGGPAAPWTVQVFDVAGITCITDPGGSGDMGIHFVDGANLMDGQIDALAPEAIIYEPVDGGGLTVVGVEHIVLVDAWHAEHHNVPILHGRTFTLVPAGNRYGLPAFYELHVWHERANPNGIFADWNPDVVCP